MVDGERVNTEAIYFNGKNIADVEEFTGCDLLPVNPVIKTARITCNRIRSASLSTLLSRTANT